MADDAPAPLTVLLQRLQVVLNRSLDFHATDTDSTLRKVRLLGAAAAYSNVLAVTEYGGQLGQEREQGLVELAIQYSGQTGWDSPLVLGSLAVGLVLLVLFVLFEPHVRVPLVELAFFRNRVFLGTLIIHFTWNWVWSVFMFLLTLYVQHVRNLSPVETGFLFLAFALPFVVASSLAGRVGALVGQRLQILSGMALVVAGAATFGFLATEASFVVIVLGFAVLGVGGALSYNAATAAGMASVPDTKSGEASGIQNTVLQLGAAFGLAVGSALFNAVESDRLATGLQRAGRQLSSSDRAELGRILAGSAAAQQRLRTLAPGVANQIDQIAKAAFMDGFHVAMLLSLGVAVVGVAAALLVRQIAPAQTATQPEAASDTSR